MKTIIRSLDSMYIVSYKLSIKTKYVNKTRSTCKVVSTKNRN